VRWPHPTIRLRLTLLFGGLFIVSSIFLLALTYGLLGQALSPLDPPEPEDFITAGDDEEMEHDGSLEEQLFEARNEERAGALQAVLTQSILALVLTSVGAMALGWTVAGRVLRPVRQITAHARRASEATLGERIGLRGPPDEIQELGDTIDAMLGRLEAAFTAQRSFAAQASHELRTPLTVIRAEAEVALAAPDVTPRERQLGETVRRAADQSERLVDGLLALSRSESTLRDNTAIDLADLVGDVVGELIPEANARGVALDLSLDRAIVRGDRTLLERLTANLVENAIRYNVAEGWVQVSVATHQDQVILQIANSGPELSSETLAALFEPFQRGRQSGSERQRGFGLGLTIVRSVAHSHRGSVEAVPAASGGLVVTVRLPAQS
jgi:signal transduction histidine kinase